MNIEQIIKKQNKVTPSLSFGFSILSILTLTSAILLTPILYQSGNNITNDALKNNMYITLYNKYWGERQINLTRVSLQKNIDQYNNLDDGEKTISLLMLVGQTHAALGGYQSLDDDLQFFYHYKKSEASFKIYKKELMKMPEENFALYQNYLAELVKYYKELPYHSIFNNHKLSKILDDQVVVSNKYIEPIILRSLYVLNNHLEHWKEIREIMLENFNPIEFNKNPDEYWKEKFAEKFGPEIPEYLKIHYLKEVDLDKAEVWINNFKTK